MSVWGEQWECPCGTMNLFLRTRCRDCGCAKPDGVPIETPFQTIARVERANEETRRVPRS